MIGQGTDPNPEKAAYCLTLAATKLPDAAARYLNRVEPDLSLAALDRVAVRARAFRPD